MDSNEIKSLAEELNDLSHNYREAAKKVFQATPGEGFRLYKLAEEAAELSEDLINIYWRKLQNEMEEEWDS